MSGKDDDMMDHEDPIMDDLDASEEFFEEDSLESAEGDVEETEDWESYDGEFTTDEGEGADPLVVKKKKSTNLIVIGGALVIGFGILLMTVANNKSVPKATDGVNNGALPGVVDNAPKFSSSTSIEVGKQAPAGLLNDPEALKNLPQTIEAAATNPNTNNAPAVPQLNPDAPVAVGGTEPVAVPAPDAVAPPMPAPQDAKPAESLTPMPAQSADSGLTAPMPEQAPVQPEVQPTVQAAAPIVTAPAEQPVPTAAMPQSSAPKAEQVMTGNEGFTVAPVMTNNNAAKDPALEAKLNQVLERMDAVEAKLAETQKQPAVNDLQSIQQALTQINSRLDKIEAQGVPAASAPSAAAETAAVPVAPKAHNVNHTSSSAATTAEKSAARWVLKSAQPGQAYVSRPGQADMISVHTGDTLPGIGRVTTIDTEAGRWIIHGTQGSISQ